MGISSTLYSGYSKQEIETNRIPTPFGAATVSISGQPISFHYTTKQHTFKNKVFVLFYNILDILSI